MSEQAWILRLGSMNKQMPSYYGVLPASYLYFLLKPFTSYSVDASHASKKVKYASYDEYSCSSWHHILIEEKACNKIPSQEEENKADRSIGYSFGASKSNVKKIQS